MSTTSVSNENIGWSRALITLGNIAMLLGAIDPMEGSMLILPGSGLVALGTYLSQSERQFAEYRVCSFILIAIGVGALWGLSMMGGFGGKSGLSMWFGLLILPYPIGWCMSILGPKSPWWLLLLSVGVGLWYLVIFEMLFKNAGRHGGDMRAVMILIGTMGLLTVGGCLFQLIKRIPNQP